MTLLHAVILGIVEGLTEFLPVSSTGHLIIAEKLLGIPSTEAVKTFDVVIQLGAILAALTIYWKSLLQNRRTLMLVLAAFIPTAVLGALLHDIVKAYLLGSATVVAASLFAGGFALIGFELWLRKRKTQSGGIDGMTPRQAIIIGTAQTLALIPGTSRSAATILGGMSLGIDRTTVVQFSFLLAIPTMAGATGLDLLKTGGSLTAHDMQMIAVGFVISFVSAFAAMRWMLSYIRTHDFILFGVYRIVAAGALWLFVL